MGWTRRRWSNGYWSRGCKTDFHIQKQSQEEQGFYLINYTSRCIPDHLKKDWWPQRGSKLTYWKDDSNAGSVWCTFSQVWQHLHQLGALTLWPFRSKRGRIFRGQQHLRGCSCLRGRSFKNYLSSYFILFLFMFWIIVNWFWYTVIMVNVCFKFITHGWF